MALTKDDDLVYLFTGTSEVFIKNRITRILQSFNKQTYAVIKYDCEITPLNNIINDCITIPFLEDLKDGLLEVLRLGTLKSRKKLLIFLWNT